MLRSSILSLIIGSGKTGIFVLALSILIPLPAAAQTMSVQNGGTIEVNNGGVWTLHGTTVDLGNAGSTTAIHETDGGRFTGGALTATRTLDAPSSATPAGLGVTISTTANLGDVIITRGHTVQTAPNGNASIRRYYDLVPSQNNSSLDATLTLHYADTELNGRTESSLEFFKSTDDGSTWAEAGADQRDATANTVTLSGIASLSRWTLGSADQPLPVEMAEFRGTAAASDRVQLTWTTASETTTAGFEVQRANANGPGDPSWHTVDFVESKAAGGTTTEATQYRFSDADFSYAVDTLAYRLKQVDLDGTTHLTDPVTIGRTVQELKLLGTFPNPARTRATVRFAVPKDLPTDAVTIRLYDVLGRQVRTVAGDTDAGRHERQLDLSNLSSGVYFLRLRAGSTGKTRRLTVVH